MVILLLTTTYAPLSSPTSAYLTNNTMLHISTCFVATVVGIISISASRVGVCAFSPHRTSSASASTMASESSTSLSRISRSNHSTLNSSRVKYAEILGKASDQDYSSSVVVAAFDPFQCSHIGWDAHDSQQQHQIGAIIRESDCSSPTSHTTTPSSSSSSSSITSTHIHSTHHTLTNSSTSQRNIFRLGNGRQYALRPTVDTLVNGMDQPYQCALLLIMRTADGGFELKRSSIVG